MCQLGLWVEPSGDSNWTQLRVYESYPITQNHPHHDVVTLSLQIYSWSKATRNGQTIHCLQLLVTNFVHYRHDLVDRR